MKIFHQEAVLTPSPSGMPPAQAFEALKLTTIAAQVPVILPPGGQAELLALAQTAFTPIEAAGGVVENEAGLLLAIFRLGMWDLPKGKVEASEAPTAAALREVEEETGLQQPEVVAALAPTYHIYQQQETWLLKTTHWYHMLSKAYQQLIPQTAEGIIQVEWIAPRALLTGEKPTYASIRELITSYLATPNS